MKVLISGGGTGGHIYPALSILKQIEEQEADSQFLYIGSQNGLESGIVRKSDIPFKSIEISGFKRKLSSDNIKTIIRFLKGVRIARQYIHQFKPDVVIGTGGYVCGPVVYAAAKMKIPTLIHEQNIVPGLTNKFLARYVDAVAVSFEGSTSHFNHGRVVFTGNPRATEVMKAKAKLGREAIGIAEDKKVIVIIGGSRGAKAINEAFFDIVNQTKEMKDCHFVYITGEVYYQQLKERMSDLDASHITLTPFVYDMPNLLAATDLIISRAGASLLAEITALGIPSILIPSPNVTNNHQEKNARWLEEKRAAKVILEQELTGQRLFDLIKEMIDDEERQALMKQAASKLGQPDAAQRIYKLIQTIVSAKRS